jgi:hypothetical protein
MIISSCRLSDQRECEPFIFDVNMIYNRDAVASIGVFVVKITNKAVVFIAVRISGAVKELISSHQRFAALLPVTIYIRAYSYWATRAFLDVQRQRERKS